jgi:hypothetical protein
LKSHWKKYFVQGDNTLEKEQEDLLYQLVEAALKSPRNERIFYLSDRCMGEDFDTVILPDNTNISVIIMDVLELIDNGFLGRISEDGDDCRFYIKSIGFKYYNEKHV